MISNVKVVSRVENLKNRENFSEINQILSTFSKISQTKEANSIIDKAFKSIVNTQPQLNTVWQNSFYSALFNTINGRTESSNLIFIPTGKVQRLAEYDRMAQSSEVDACLDEIADSSINYNEKQQIIEIKFNDDVYYIPDNPNAQKLRDELEQKKEVIRREFYKFITPLKLKTRLHRYIKNFLKTGECLWENIIDPENKDLGIIDFKFLPTHSFDFAYDKETREKKGFWIRVLRTKVGSSLNYDDGGAAASAPLRASNYTSFNGSQYPLQMYNRFDDYSQGDLIFLPFEECTYVESGEHSPDDLIVYPIIEKARRAYNQLVCTEDAIIIYRLARSPTRLVFNVGVGMANNSRGAQQLQQLIRKYNVSKTYDSTLGTVNSRDPHTMTESFWFMKSANGEGTDVTELSSSVDMGELNDLLFFLRKLWRALRVPEKRFTEEESVYIRSNDGISQAEYRFCKFIIRILANFSEGIKNTFNTHLSLIGLKNSLNIPDAFFDIHFVNPISYELYEQARVLAARVEMYKSISENEEFSKTLAMKKFLNFTEADVEENWIELEKDTIRKKLIEAKADAVTEDEVEAFKKQLQAERKIKDIEQNKSSHYYSTEDAVDDAIDTEKSDEIKKNGIDNIINNQNSQLQNSQQNLDFKNNIQDNEQTIQ